MWLSIRITQASLDEEALSEIVVCVFLLWEILLIGIYLPMTPVTTTIYICFVFTTFPSLRHLVSWEQDIMIKAQEEMTKSEKQHLEECRFVAPDQNWLWNDPWSKVKLDRTRKHINGGNCYDPHCRHFFIRLTNLDYRRCILLMPAIRD